MFISENKMNKFEEIIWGFFCVLGRGFVYIFQHIFEFEPDPYYQIEQEEDSNWQWDPASYKHEPYPSCKWYPEQRNICLDNIHKKESTLRVYTCKMCDDSFFTPTQAIECCICPEYKAGDFLAYNLPYLHGLVFQNIKWVGRFGDGTKEFHFVVTSIEKSETTVKYNIKTLAIENALSQGWILKGDPGVSRITNVPEKVKQESLQFIGKKYPLPLSER